MKYSLQTASAKHTGGLQETALQGTELNCLTSLVLLSGEVSQPEAECEG